MDDAELDRLARDPESDRVERKERVSRNNLDEVRKVVCAFANDMADRRAPGVLFVGLRDDGSPSGAPINDELLVLLSGIRDDGAIQPLPSMQVRKHTIDGADVVAVIVEPSDAPPVRWDGRTWIRVGPRRGRATPEDERRLAEKRRWKNLPFDIQPASGATLADLDLPYFTSEFLPQAVSADVIAENQRSVEQQLLGLRLIDLEGTPTHVGCLTIGIDPRRHVPGAYVQFARFDGDTLISPVLDQKEIGGRIAEQVRRTEDLLEAHNPVSGEFVTAPIEQRSTPYPLGALRQLVRNALMHRRYEGTNAPVRVYWFTDRIEIQSPGGPFGQVTVDNFSRGAVDYRNPHLAEAMKHLGFVQRFGAGFEIVRSELARNGNPPFEAEVHPGHVMIRIWRAR
jgi:ATP-dependent DNA helicase RecG